MNLGLGSAVSILIFICVILIAVFFVKVLGASTAQQRGESHDGATPAARRSLLGASAILVVLLYALIPVAWIVSLSLKTPDARSATASFLPSESTFDNYDAIFYDDRASPTRCVNSIGIALDRHADRDRRSPSMAAYAISRLDFPGKALILAGALAVAMFPPISIVGVAVQHLARRSASTTRGSGLIIPYMTFTLPLAIYTLSAFFREIPWELETGGAGGRRDAVPGVPARSSCRWPRRACSPPAILVFIFAWNDFLFANIADLDRQRAHRARRRSRSSRARRSSSSRSARSRPAAVVVTIPIIIMVLIFQRRIVAGLTAGAVKG